MAKKSMRDDMPQVAAFIDAMRAVFGQDVIDDLIRRGLKGEPTFFASENGHVIGTPLEHGTSAITWDEQGRSVSVDINRSRA